MTEDELEDELEEAEQEDSLELMSPDDIRRMDMIKQFAVNATTTLADGISLDHRGVFHITKEADEMGLREAALYLNDNDLNCESMGTIMKLGIARVVLQLAAMQDKDEVEVIDELGLVERIGRSLSSFKRWNRVVRILPESSFRFGLNMNQYEALVVVVPEDKALVPAFNAKRDHLVDRVAADPNAFPRTLIEKEIRQILSSVEPKDKKDKDKKPRPDSLGVIMRRMVDCYRVKEVAGLDESILKNVGVSMSDISTQIEADKSELINRNEIHADVEKTVLHFGGQTIEVESTTDEEE